MTPRAPIQVAVIPAAGLGTRSLPWSKTVPKEMMPIVDRPAIEVIVAEATAAGIEEIVLVTGRGKGALEDHFDRAPELERALAAKGKDDLLEAVLAPARVSVVSVRQKQPLGLGHAVLCARRAVGERPFAVILPDDLVDNPLETGGSGVAQVCRAYNETGKSAVAVLEVEVGQEHLYGIVAGPDDAGRIAIDTMVEKPAPGTAPSRSAIIGRYALSPAVWPLLESTTPGAIGEIQLTDALQKLAASGDLLGVHLAGVRHDIGSPMGWLAANLHYGLQRDDLGGELRALIEQLAKGG
jgi:UTP--glucose-1-phosphate uridylyltransferase